MSELDSLHDRVYEAAKVLGETYKAVAQLEIKIDERTATTIPLILGALDMADAIFVLLTKRTERSWVAALALQRSQMEYVLRAAFFARAASHKELMTFRRKGKMPKRSERDIHVSKVAEEGAQQLGWDVDTLLEVVKVHQRELSSAVHGGKEILAVYTQHEEWGNIEVPWSELGHHIDNVLIFSQLALGVAMYHSALEPAKLDSAVRTCYEAARTYFEKWV